MARSMKVGDSVKVIKMVPNYSGRLGMTGRIIEVYLSGHYEVDFGDTSLYFYTHEVEHFLSLEDMAKIWLQE